jgi:hypothetical protein
MNIRLNITIKLMDNITNNITNNSGLVYYNPCYKHHMNSNFTNMCMSNNVCDNVFHVDAMIDHVKDFNIDMLCDKNVEHVAVHDAYNILKTNNVMNNVCYLNTSIDIDDTLSKIYSILKSMILYNFHDYIPYSNDMEFDTRLITKTSDSKSFVSHDNIIENVRKRFVTVLIVYGQFDNDRILIHDDDSTVFTLSNDTVNIVIFNTDRYTLRLRECTSCVVMESYIEFERCYKYITKLYNNALLVPSTTVLLKNIDRLTDIVDNTDIINNTNTIHNYRKLNEYTVIAHGVMYGNEVYDINRTMSMIDDVDTRFVMLVLKNYYASNVQYDDMLLEDKRLVYVLRNRYGSLCTQNISKHLYNGDRYRHEEWYGFSVLHNKENTKGKTEYFARFVPSVLTDINEYYTSNKYYEHLGIRYEDMNNYTCLLLRL